ALRHEHRERLHRPAARRLPVAREVVHVAAPEALRAVVALGCPERERIDLLLALHAAKRIFSHLPYCAPFAGLLAPFPIAASSPSRRRDSRRSRMASQ